MNRKELFEEYFVRQEYILEIKNSYIDCEKYIDFIKTLYKILKLKSQIIQYCILKNKYGNHLNNIIETLFDYDYIEMSNLITNHLIIEERKVNSLLNAAKYNSKKNIILRNKSKK